MHDSFYVYRGQGGSPLTVPLIILTTKTEQPNEWYGEYFLLISRPRICCIWKGQSVDGTAVPEDIFRVDESWILGEITRQAETVVKLAAESHAWKTGEKNVSEDFRLHAGDRSDLAQAWLRGEFQNEIAGIASVTKAVALRDYLKTLQNIPPIVGTPQPYKSPFQ